VPFAELADVRLHYRFDGDDDAPVLMLSNSLGTDLAMWDPQVPYLAERYRVLRYDSRGHGRSEVTKGPYVIAQLARDTLGLLDYLRLRQVRFCGLSIGGMVGQWLGANAAKRFERLVLCNTAAQIGSHEIWNDRMDAVNKRGMAAIVDGVLARWYTAPFIAAAPDSIAATREMLLTTPASGYGCLLCRGTRHGPARFDIAHHGPDARHCRHLRHGNHASGWPIPADRIAGARYAELPAAHLSNIEAPAAFIAAVTEFIA